MHKKNFNVDDENKSWTDANHSNFRQLLANNNGSPDLGQESPSKKYKHHLQVTCAVSIPYQFCSILVRTWHVPKKTVMTLSLK